MNHSTIKTVLLITGFLLSMTLPALAIPPIPAESGFSGYVNIGAAYAEFENNMVVGIKSYDLGKKRITSLDESLDSESTGLPAFNIELVYTFAPQRTQLFLGNSLEDLLRLDSSGQLGIRHELGDTSIVAASFVFSSQPTEVWEDPYVINQNRIETDRTSKGVRLTWDRILDSELQLEYTYRKIDIDTERSGTFLGLSLFEALLLDRNGKQHTAEILYRFFLHEKKQRIIPSFQYTRFDLDGEAMANDTYLFQLTYGYEGKKFPFVVNGMISTADYDKRNPVFNKTREDDRWGGSVMVFYRTPFGWQGPSFVKGWSLWVNGAYYESDSNIDFYDSNITMYGAGALFVF